MNYEGIHPPWGGLHVVEFEHITPVKIKIIPVKIEGQVSQNLEQFCPIQIKSQVPSVPTIRSVPTLESDIVGSSRGLLCARSGS
ncbi:unnamed protein product [Prunus brigantina]